MYRKFYLTLLLVSAAVLFVFSLIAIGREMNPEWKEYQLKYKESFLENARDPDIVAKAESIEPEHRQIYLRTLEKVDRCMSCHIGVENPLMADAEVPYRQHSGPYLEDHPVAKFGCTVCHEGQGRATNKKEAHGTALETHWDYPILPLKYIQSSCAKCHDSKMLEHNGGEKVVKGETLFRTKGCKGCHKLNGKGGVLGKKLDGIGTQPIHYFPLKHVEGEKTTYAWLKEHFMDPRKIVPESEMKVVLTDEEADLLTTYVLSIRSDEAPKEYRRIQAYREKPMDGEALYEMYCVACHTTGKTSYYDEIFSRTIPAIMNRPFLKSIDDGFLKKIIKEGRADTQMTAWKSDAAGLSEAEINRIVGYITRNRPSERPEPFGFASFRTDVARGEELYGERCRLCHGSDAKGGKDILGINLKNPVVQNADPEYLAVTVRDGRPGTPMAPFGEAGLKLSDQEIADIVAYIKSL